MGLPPTPAKDNKAATVNNLLQTPFISPSFSLNENPVSLHENKYHYKSYLEKLLNYGSDAKSIHLNTSFW
jgi:hypothetical protein